MSGRAFRLPRYTRKRDVINNKRRFRKRSNATFFNVNSLLSMESVRKRLSSTPEMYVLFMYAVNDYIAKQSTTCSFVCRVVGLTNGCPYVTNEIKSLIKDGSKFYLHGMVIHFYCPMDHQWRIIKEDEIKNELEWMEILMENAKLQRTDDVDKIKFYRDGHGIKISIDFFQKVKVNEKNITLTDHTYITNLYRHCMLSQMSRIKEKRRHYIYYTPELFLYFRIATRYFTIFIPFLQMPLTVIHFAALCACWNYIRTMIMKAWKKTFRKYFAKALPYIENKVNIPQYTLMNITLYVTYICDYMFIMMINIV
ncbi:hypothetical protein T03_13495 [Trichinella britovi]|uniref:Uncharacterized protein n=2 Tax=Trichinella britovi TaxID=45882 RepID=A0A0V1D322_TRIBR|nr:hypothetical protein T03_13495 [Trichinella britovi]